MKGKQIMASYRKKQQISEDDKQIIDMYYSCIPYKVIAKKLNISVTNVCLRIKKLRSEGVEVKRNYEE